MFLGLFCLNINTTYLNYVLINWYTLLLDSTDVYSIMSSFYEYNPFIIINIGLLITVLTFIVGNIVIIYYCSRISLKSINLSLKNQKKKRQILKKPTIHIFSKNFKNDF